MMLDLITSEHESDQSTADIDMLLQQLVQCHYNDILLVVTAMADMRCKDLQA